MSSADLKFEIAINAIEVVVIAIGLIGHLLTIIIFLRKIFRNNSISTYCISLAIADSLSIIRLINIIYFLPYNAYLMDLNEAYCKVESYAEVLVSAIQPYIMVAFSIDKILSMRTSSIAIIKKKWFQCSVVAGIALFHIGLYMYYPILVRRSEVFPWYYLCDVTTIGLVTMHLILLLIENSLIPLVLLMITSIITIRLLLKSSSRIGRLTNERKSRDRKYAISSVTLNIICIVLKLPLAIFYILLGFFNYYNVYLPNVGYLLFYLNTSMGFLIHIVTNSLFRKEFLVIFRSVKRSIESPIKSILSSRTNRVSSF